ncbi:MAG: adenosine deaminase [Actinobacteria bacterium]|uniref:adenosine deaminase n=1 Tax=freshwater metagenome TaxID=449393 RepID=A0A6J7AY31_9ZZZZ|nr:adenosine deaminase [Actinomycetota bacterium]MSY35344.1 adenosine deaminase [Actinomycetota bacterium]MTA72733.1 adenosine deaminase [Actinomycetota bacterium]MTB28906.1 adenosine deaminase [Actinomycetota bacterium]MUH48335.1 adenosine deaminase [Actinomycetota bacterium]
MAMTSIPSEDQIKRLPKVLLHDHLDGGLRPQTIIDIAKEIGYTALPTHDAEELATWFRESCDSGSLVRYLETFSHTIAVMQRREDIIRVARECALDLARDGVVYAEVRGAPELFTEQGLTMSDVVEATIEGYRLGMADAAAEGFTISVFSLLCGMRQNKKSQEVAELVVKYRGQGVVGFDIAGPEDGFPPSDQKESFDYLRKEDAHYTIHAGEAYGIPSIWEAIQICGAERLGHGVRIIDDIDFSGPEPKLGQLASYVRDRRIPLELCPTSNLQTGAAKSYAEHPIGALARLRFRVTLNTDNRLMSQTSMSLEMREAVKAFNWDFAELQRITINAMKSAFISYPDRLKIIEGIIKPGYAKISSE